MFHDTGFGSDFLDMTPKAQATENKKNRLDFMKILKTLSTEEEGNPQNGRKYLQIMYLTRDL